ncbi:glycosyltransferase [Alkalimarinus coralli]|uniref:glycosyltransferase n=1 Tax=Alkalimarinus coralli TaxID=2935863 RepID=UPI00202BA409|nr:glycosyltransferase [Alkalimarinus coralli]
MAIQNNKKIAFFLPDLRIGGAEKVFVQLANSLSEQGYNVDLLLAQKAGNLFPLVNSKVPILAFCQGRKSQLSLLLSSLKGLYFYTTNNKPDVIFSTITGANLVAALVRVFLPNQSTKFILREASSVHNSGLVYRWLSRMLYPQSDAVLAGSKGVIDDMVSYYRVDRDKAHLIRNPVDLTSIKSQASEKVVHPWLLNNDFPLIVSVGRLTTAKDFVTLIKAFKLVRDERASKLIIIGEGECRAELEEKVSVLGLMNDVDFLGFRENPHPFVSSANVFVLSSRWEGFPNVILEALALGRNVVSTDCHAGPAEILSGIGGCTLVPVGDSEKMASAISEKLNGELDVREADIRLKEYSIKAVSQKYSELMDSI